MSNEIIALSVLVVVVMLGISLFMWIFGAFDWIKGLFRKDKPTSKTQDPVYTALEIQDAVFNTGERENEHDVHLVKHAKAVRDEEAEKLIALGFMNAGYLKEYNNMMVSVPHAKQRIKEYKALVKDYPGYKIIHKGDLDSLLEKYSLPMVRSIYLIDGIPEVSRKDIVNFPGVLDKHKHFVHSKKYWEENSYSSYEEYLEQITLEMSYPLVIASKDLLNSYHIKHGMRTNGVFNSGSSSNSMCDDPIVLYPLYVSKEKLREASYFIILTAWGE